jgi:hypothetical protein
VPAGAKIGSKLGKFGMKVVECVTKENSFAADTQVVMADGSTRRIDEVKLGDRVLATNPADGTTAPQTVTATIVGDGIKSLVDVTVDGESALGLRLRGSLTATAGHPFFRDSNKTWVIAADLRPGDKLTLAPGSTNSRALTKATVVSTRLHQTKARVYNLTVANTHTYYVLAGATPVLVHNAGCGPIKYGASALSKLAVKARQQVGIEAGQNVAIYTVKLPNGETANLAFANTIRGAHSEAHADDLLDMVGIDPNDVTAIYSERNFCTTSRHECAGRMGRFPNAALSWSFEKGDNAIAIIRRVVSGG